MHSFICSCTMERDGHYSFLTNNIFKNERNLFGKGCHYEKNEQWTTEMVRSVNWKNTFSKNKQKNIKKNDLKLYQHTWKKTIVY